MSAGSGGTRYFGPKEAIAREKGAPPRPVDLAAGNTRQSIARKNALAAKRADKRERTKEAARLREQAAKTLAQVKRSQDLDEQTKLIDSITLRGLRHAAGLFLEPVEEGYNPDALVPMPDASTRTHFGMTVYKNMMAQKREGMATARALGVVLLQGRKGEAEWNAEARRVDEEQRHAQAIDVAAELIKEGAGDE